ncbi:hypothetical protein Q75_02905 [Bacillus coahuilensis p1.1.43]|uniref:Resolvase/invertase-type recombinase catalytic domain-containing protein n=1 Tax=Bacillus coahuilensis p1.1.43 TaxID=1150625 RepID=A0A147KBA8_9BACI|nr:hypothetical protein [Bacillus coahuilensis]KUP08429.1 hypothetical protein Q75_02905 [Bacillus coahuilensis p1.1.43]
MDKKTVIYIYQPSGNNLQQRLHDDLEELLEFVKEQDIKLNGGFVLYDHSGLRENIHVLYRMAIFDELERIVIKDLSHLGKTNTISNNTFKFLIEKGIEVLTPNEQFILDRRNY